MSLAFIRSLYAQNEEIRNFSQILKNQPHDKFRLNGLVGSQMAFVIGTLHQHINEYTLVVLQDREEALYIQNDLELLFPELHIMLFPASSKRPYQIEKIDNANVMQRAETLSLLNQIPAGQAIIITYPEALYEKVIDRKSLVTHTLTINLKDRLDMSFVLEVLDSYHYERTDFATKPGQYAIRGGLLDVYTYSHDKPYRLDFMDDEIENIRVFDPDTQLTEYNTERITIIPNINLHITSESRVSLLQYISPLTRIFIQDINTTSQELDRLYSKAQDLYNAQQKASGGSSIQRKPKELFWDGNEFLHEIEQATAIELGSPFYFKEVKELNWNSAPQPHIHKQFQILVEHLTQNQKDRITNYICAENEKQQNRIAEIFHSINTDLQFTSILQSIHKGFLDKNLGIAVYTDHQIFDRYFRYKVKTEKLSGKAFTLKEMLQLQPGDYVTHITHGVGRFGGLEKRMQGDIEHEAAKIFFGDDSVVYVNVTSLHKLSKYSSKDGTAPKLSKLGSSEWTKMKSKVKKRLKELAFDLVNLYAHRKALKGYAFSPDDYMQNELEASFIYEETTDQMRAIEEVKSDMESSNPMDRLICGDVGFGKTEVAIRAAFKAACNGKQVVILAPTTILAMQHYYNFRDRYSKFPVTVNYITRLRTAKDTTLLLKDVEGGKIDILIGTHRVLSKDVKFKNLGLIIIDEEHKFGVGHKEKLKLLKTNVDTLTLTATPIPRTLQFSLLGIRDMSLITTPPANRQPVETQVRIFDNEVLRDAIAYELRRGGQVFFIHNRIKDLQDIAALIKKLVPDAKIAFAHGQLDPEEVENTMLRFINHEYDVLVSTTIIESGLDIPNANTIIINQAHNFGLSDLHQMRGRVGRSNRKAFCYLFAPSLFTLTTDARKRLQALEQFSDLGSGFQIAMRDLDIRGAGDILGKEQSGFVADLGYEAYQQVLNEAIRELKREKGFQFADEESIAPTGEVFIDIEEDIKIPDSYIPNVAERLNFYKRLSDSNSETELQTVSKEMIDRFGIMPPSVFTLIDTIRIRDIAEKLGFEKLIYKNKTAKAHFPKETETEYYKSNIFQGILQFVGENSSTVNLTQTRNGLVLVLENAKTLKDVYFRLRKAYQSTQEPVKEVQL